MGTESIGVGEAVAKGGLFALNPFSKITFIITAILFLCLGVIGTIESFQVGSVYPLLDKTIFKVVSADFQIGSAVDSLESSPRPIHPSSMFSKAFPTWLLFWCVWWFGIIADIFFIYFFIFLIYFCWSLTDDGLILRNAIFTTITFIIISMFVGMIFFNLSLAGTYVPSGKTKIFNTQMSHIYPFHGIIKLITHFITKDLFYRVDEFANSPFGQVINYIPNSGINMSNNVSEGI